MSCHADAKAWKVDAKAWKVDAKAWKVDAKAWKDDDKSCEVIPFPRQVTAFPLPMNSIWRRGNSMRARHGKAYAGAYGFPLLP
jgi:hypothetical protein